MNYHLAQLNIAKFKLPQEHPANADFINNLDKVNALAEDSSGFVWRLVGDGNDAMDIQAFDNPNIISNLSVWEDIDSLVAFVYKNNEHKQIMRRRKEWFEKMDFYMVLWWIAEGHTPNITEAKQRLEQLERKGAGPDAFTFANPYNYDGSYLGSIKEKCA